MNFIEHFNRQTISLIPMPYFATSEVPQANIVIPPLIVWAHRVLHVVFVVIQLGLGGLGLLRKSLYLLTLNGLCGHSLVSPPSLLLGILIILTPLSLALSASLTTTSDLVV